MAAQVLHGLKLHGYSTDTRDREIGSETERG